MFNSIGDNILDYFIEKKNIQKEKEKDSIIHKQQKDLVSLSKEFIRISQENSELRMVISIKHDVELKLKDAEFTLNQLQQQNQKLLLDSKYLESKLNKKIDNVLLEKKYEKMKMEQNELLYRQKIFMIRHIEMENEIYKEEVQNLKRQIEILKGLTDSKLKQIEIENAIKYSQLKKKMTDNLNETKKRLSKLNLKYLDGSNRVSNLQNYQLLIEVEAQNSKIEQLVKENEMLQKKLSELKYDLDIHQKVEVNLATKIKKERNKKPSNSSYTKRINSNKKPINNEISRSFSALLLSKNTKNNTINDISLIKQKLKRIKENDIKNRNIKNKNKNNSFNKTNKNLSDSLSIKKDEYIDKDKDKDNNLLEIKFNKYINCMNFKKTEKDKLIQNNEILKLKIEHYEQKYRGLFKFLEESIENFFNDIKNIINLKTVNIDYEKLKKFNFNEFSKEEQYSILVLLMDYLMPLIYSNFNSNCNVGTNNVFKTNLNLIDRSFNKTYNYLNDKMLRKAFVGKDNKLCVELYMDKNIKNNFCNCIPVFKRNNSSKIIFDKKSKSIL